MFMDTPKLQPISKSKPKTSEQQNVPSGSNNNTSGGSASTSSAKGGYSASSSSNNTSNDNKPQNSGASSATVHDAGDIRHNSNSYRKNNCSPNPFQKPFNKPYFGDRSKERRNYYNNNNKHSNSPYPRGIWEDPPNIIRWQPNFNFNNNNRYRKFGHYNSYHGNSPKAEINRLRENNTQFEDFDYPEDTIRTQFDDDKSSTSSSSAFNGDGVNNKKANNNNNNNNNNKRSNTNQNKKPETPRKPKSPKTPTKSCSKTTSVKQNPKTGETANSQSTSKQSLKSSSKSTSKQSPKRTPKQNLPQSPKPNSKSDPKNSPKLKEKALQLKAEEKHLQNKFTANNNSSAAEANVSIVPISNEKIIQKNHNNKQSPQQSPKPTNSKSGPKNSPKSKEKATQLKAEEKHLQNKFTANNNGSAAETNESIAPTSKEQIVAKIPTNKQTDITKQLKSLIVIPTPPKQATKAKPKSPLKGNFKNRSPKQAKKPLAKKTINILSGSRSGSATVAEANNTLCHKRKINEVLNNDKSEELEFSLTESLPSIYVVNNISSSSTAACRPNSPKKQKISEEFTTASKTIGEEVKTTDNTLGKGIAKPIAPCEKPANVKPAAVVGEKLTNPLQTIAKHTKLCEETIANVKQTAVVSPQVKHPSQTIAKPTTLCEEAVVNAKQTTVVSQQISHPQQSIVKPTTLCEETVVTVKQTLVVTSERISDQPTTNQDFQVTSDKDVQLLPEDNNKPQTEDNLNTVHKESLCAKSISSQDIDTISDTSPSTVAAPSKELNYVGFAKTVEKINGHSLFCKESICEIEVSLTQNSACDIPNPTLSLSSSSSPLPAIIQTNNGISEGNSKPPNQQQEALEPTNFEYILHRMTDNLHSSAQQEPAKEDRIEIDSSIPLEQQPSTPSLPLPPPAAAAVLTANSSTEEEEHNVHQHSAAEFQLPKISLIPLSRLIASEYWEDLQPASNAADEVSLLDITPKIVAPPSTPPQRHIFKPNLVKRKRNVSTCSNTSTTSNSALTVDPIVDKLAAMNKINLKHIINSSDTKYDEALQQQARKRLREEIRHQLRSLNVEPNIVGHKESHIADFVPDEIVDSINIPDFVLEEIRKALTLSSSEEDQQHLNTVTKELLALSPESNAAKQLETSTEIAVPQAATATQQLDTRPEQQSETPAELAVSPAATATKQLETPPDPAVSPPANNMVNLDNILAHNGSTMSSGKSQRCPEKQQPTSLSRSSVSNGIKPEQPMAVRVKREMLEETTQTQHKVKNLRKHKKSRKYSKKKKSKSPKMLEDIIVLDSSSNSSGNSSSSSTSSTSSSTSSSSSSDSESDTSKRSSSSAIKRKRLKLKVDAENVVDSFEKLILPSLSERLQERYRSKHSNSTHTKLHFISCICVSDYNSEKFSKLEIAKIQRNLKSTDCTMALEFLMREIVNVFSKQKQAAKENEAGNPSSPSKAKSQDHVDHDSHQVKSILPEKQAPSAAKSLESAPANAIADLDSENAIQKCVSKVLSLYRQEMKAAAATSQQPAAPTPVTSATTTTPATPTGPPTLNAATLAPQLSAAKASQHDNSDSYKTGNGVKLHKDEPAQQHLNRITQLQRETENQFNHIRSLTTSLSSSDYSLIPIDTTSMRFNSTIFDFPTTSYRQPPTFPPLDLETLKKQSPIGEAVVNNLREIDVKLMELHKRKMYIEEMILKLQKDKMDTDLLTIKLQNEKFILLNTAMTANVTNSTTTSGATKEKMEAAVPTATAAAINCAEIAINLKNIKTETVVIPDDDDDRPKIQCTPLAQLTKVVVQPDPAATNPEPLLTENSTIPTKEVILPVANQPLSPKRNAHITSSSTSTRKTKRKSTSEPTNIGETFKRLREKAQKVKSIKKAQQSNATSVIHSSSNGSGDNDLSSGQNQKAANANEDLNNITSSKNGRATPDCNTNHAVGNLTANVVTEPEKAQNHNFNNDVLPTTTTSSSASAAAILSRLTSDGALSILTKQPYRVQINVDASNGGAIVTEDAYAEKLFDLKNMRLGLFKGLSSPIAQVRLYENIVIASSESGKIFTFDAETLELITSYNKHTEAITQTFLCEAKGFLFTTSLDGYFKKSLLKNLSCGTQSVYLKEPLQTLDIQWDMAFIGSRWGNIYTCNIMANIGSATQLCTTDSSIITIKAAKEGPRKVLIVTSKGNLLHVRDASSGLLLRTFDVPDCINVYSILLNEGILYCGTQKKEIRKYEFVSGAPQGSITCGNGAVSMLMFRNKYMFVGCYDGYIYILDKETGRQITRLAGSGKMILTIEIVGDKIITSAKDCTMKVISIPTYCLGNSL